MYIYMNETLIKELTSYSIRNNPETQAKLNDTTQK